MAYDEELANRIREVLTDEPTVRERKMFGGLAFLLGGNMAVSASRRGGLMVRADPARSDQLVATTAAETMVMQGREMRGWLYLEADDVRTMRQLRRWVGIGAAYARTLPSK